MTKWIFECLVPRTSLSRKKIPELSTTISWYYRLIESPQLSCLLHLLSLLLFCLLLPLEVLQYRFKHKRNSWILKAYTHGFIADETNDKNATQSHAWSIALRASHVSGMNNSAIDAARVGIHSDTNRPITMATVSAAFLFLRATLVCLRLNSLRAIFFICVFAAL